MSKEKLLEFAAWINAKLSRVNDTIIDAKNKHNYGKATQYAGKRDAYKEILDRVNQEISQITKIH